MSNSRPVIAELVGRRAALIREQRRLYRELMAVGRELSSVRSELRKIVPRLRGIGNSLPFRHLIRNVLAKRPMLTTELALLVMRGLELDAANKPLYLATRKRVHACLKELRRKGEVASARVPGKQARRWEIAG